MVSPPSGPGPSPKQTMRGDAFGWRDLAYFVRERGRLVHNIEPDCRITVYG